MKLLKLSFNRGLKDYIKKPFRNILHLQVTREWFPLRESAVASGGITLAMVLGSAFGLSVTPLFALRDCTNDIHKMSRF